MRIFLTLLFLIGLSGCQESFKLTISCESKTGNQVDCIGGAISSESVISSSSEPASSSSVISSSSEPASSSSVISSSSEPVSSSSVISSSSEPAMTDLGFTKLEPSEDSLMIYVSNSEGDDGNTCRSPASPCKSLQAGMNLMREGFPDYLLLKRGDVWREGKEPLNDLQNGRSPQEMAVISYYGDTGPRPRIEAAHELYRQDKRDVKHLAFVGLHFYGYKKDPLHPEHDPGAPNADMRFIGRFENILLEDNKFEFAGMTIQIIGDFVPRDFTVKRNIFAGVYVNQTSLTRSAKPSNVFTHGVVGQRFIENVFDYGGWHPTVLNAGANMLSHNVYMQWQSDGDKTEFINNIVVRGASHGIQMRSGGIAQDNFFARNAVGILMGYGEPGREVPAGVRAHMIDNVVTEGWSQWKGVNPCVASNVCSTAVWALNIAINSGADYQARGNIASGLLPEDVEHVRNNDDGTVTPLKIQAAGLNFDTKATEWVSFFEYSGNHEYMWEDQPRTTHDKVAGLFNEFPSATPFEYRTLADYSASLGNARDFDVFMDIVKNREPGTWDTDYTARSINAFIRETFQ